MINQLTDSFDDVSLLEYGEKNLRYLESLSSVGTFNLSSEIGKSPIGINPAYKYCVVSTDTLISLVFHIKHTKEYFNQSSEELYAQINAWINEQIKIKVRYRRYNPQLSPHETFMMHPYYEFYKGQIKKEFVFDDLTFPCKDLLLLSIIAFNFSMKLNPKEFIDYCTVEKERYLLLIREMP